MTNPKVCREKGQPGRLKKVGFEGSGKNVSENNKKKGQISLPQWADKVKQRKFSGRGQWENVKKKGGGEASTRRSKQAPGPEGKLLAKHLRVKKESPRGKKENNPKSECLGEAPKGQKKKKKGLAESGGDTIRLKAGEKGKGRWQRLGRGRPLEKRRRGNRVIRKRGQNRPSRLAGGGGEGGPTKEKGGGVSWEE